MSPPAAPTNLTAALRTSTGAIELAWKSRQPPGVRGVAFQIFRVEGTRGRGGPAEFVGFTGARTFVDAAPRTRGR